MNRENIMQLNETIKTKIRTLNEVRLKNGNDEEQLQCLNYIYGCDNINKCLNNDVAEKSSFTNGSIYNFEYPGSYVSLATLKLFRDRIDHTIQHYDELLYEAMLKDDERVDKIIANYNASHKKQIKI